MPDRPPTQELKAYIDQHRDIYRAEQICKVLHIAPSRHRRHAVAFVVDVFARGIVGWRVSSSMHADLVLDALEQALFDRQPERHTMLAHHFDRG